MAQSKPFCKLSGEWNGVMHAEYEGGKFLVVILKKGPFEHTCVAQSLTFCLNPEPLCKSLKDLLSHYIIMQQNL